LASPKNHGGIHLAQIAETLTGPAVYNLELQASGTVYSQALTAPIRGIEVQASGNYDVRMAFRSGEIEANNYWTVFAGASYSREFDQPWPDLTAYFASEFDDNVEASRGIQLIEWRGGV